MSEFDKPSPVPGVITIDYDRYLRLCAIEEIARDMLIKVDRAEMTLVMTARKDAVEGELTGKLRDKFTEIKDCTKD